MIFKKKKKSLQTRVYVNVSVVRLASTLHMTPVTICSRHCLLGFLSLIVTVARVSVTMWERPWKDSLSSAFVQRFVKWCGVSLCVGRIKTLFERIFFSQLNFKALLTHARGLWELLIQSANKLLHVSFGPPCVSIPFPLYSFDSE